MAIRNFKLVGVTFGSENVNAIITINNTEVFNGALTPQNDATLQAPIATGSIELNDATAIVVPVNITITSGAAASFGMFQWNCLVTKPNPVYTSEQYATLVNPATTNAERAAIAQTIANPPFNADELALLSSNDDGLEIKAILFEHNASLDVPDEDTYGYGRTEELTSDNRDLVKIDGVTTAFDDNSFIFLTPGQVLTFDQIIFGRYV